MVFNPGFFFLFLFFCFVLLKVAKYREPNPQEVSVGDKGQVERGKWPVYEVVLLRGKANYFSPGRFA